MSEMETNSTSSCTECEEKEERIQKISDEIKQKIEAYKELSADCPLPVDYLIANVLNVLKKFNPPAPNKEDGNHHHDTTAKEKEQEAEPAQNATVNINMNVQEPQITTLVKIESSPPRCTSSSPLPLPLQLPTSTNESCEFVESTRKRKLSTSSASSASSTCTIPVRKQQRRTIQTPDISSSCSSPGPTPSNSFHSSTIPGPSSTIKLQVQANTGTSGRLSSLAHIPRASTEILVETAKQSPLVLQNILKYLNYDDLQSCCTAYEEREWKEQVENIMSNRTIFTISISRNKPQIAKTINDKHFHSEYRDMDRLSTALEDEERGHEIWISVHNRDLTYKPLSNFLQKFSLHITRLTLCCGTLDKSTPQKFHKLLLSLPNVTQLSLATLPEEWESTKQRIFPLNSSTCTNEYGDENVDESLLLPRMKSILFKASPKFYPEFIQSLLQVTPHVKFVFNFPLHCLPALDIWKDLSPNNKSSFQLDKIKSVHFSSSDRTPTAGVAKKLQLEALAKISSQMNLSAVHLSFKISNKDESFQLWIQCCASLIKILEDNKKSIKYLKIEPFPQQEYLKYPEMSGLNKLHLFIPKIEQKQEGVGGVCKFFPEGLNFLKTFPNLTKVKFEGTNCALGDFLEFFPSDIFKGNPSSGSGFQHVTSLNLKFERLEDETSLQKAALLFPGVRNFSMDGDVQWLETRLLHILSLWPRLQKLKLTVDVVMTSRRFTSFSMYPLDSVFTGIPEAKCAELRQTEEKMNININEWRENFAISNMTDLTELKLIFAGNFVKTQKVIKLFSHVTALYGFQLLPNLKVAFSIPLPNPDHEKIQKMLKPIQNYVDFQPELLVQNIPKKFDERDEPDDEISVVYESDILDHAQSFANHLKLLND